MNLKEKSGEKAMVTTESIKKAVGEVKKGKSRKFTQSIDLVINLKHLDMNKPENKIDQEVLLPKGRGKEVKIALFADGELAHQAKKIVNLVIEKDDIEGLAKDKKKGKKLAQDHNFFLSQTDMMALIGKTLGPVLGPRGKMPKPIPPNIDIKPLVERLKRTVKIRTKDKTTFHLAIGTEGMSEDDLTKNAVEIIETLETKFGKGSQNIRSVYLKKTMSSSVKVGGV
jgi:large subunit ribosomal protein L1